MFEFDLKKDMEPLIFGWRLGKKVVDARRKAKERKQLEREISHTKQTGLPAPDSEIGRKAREVLAAEEEKLRNPPPVHGSARWGEAADAELMIGTRPGAELLLGFLMQGDEDTGVPIVARYPGHLLTVAATGQGKSATQIIANLITYRGSIVVIDPKGELYDITGEHRRQFGKVFRLAPLARAGDPPSDHYNPLDELGDERERGNRARRLAEMLIVRQSDKGAAESAYFENEAINLLVALIMAVIEFSELEQNDQDKTLTEVRRILALPLRGDRPSPKDDPKQPAAKAPKVEYFEDALRDLAALGKSRLVRQQLASFANMPEKQLGSFISEINSNLAFLDGHVGFEEVLSKSDFHFADLAKEPTTVYLTVPFKDMATSFRYLRAMIGQAFGALEEQRDAQQASVLFILDEFPALKDMQFMHEAVAQMRSSGAWFWFFVQDIAQLQATYGKHAEVFLSQTDHQIFFGAVNDSHTKKYISTSLGVETFAYRDGSVSWGHNVGGNTSTSESDAVMQPGNRGNGHSTGQSVNINNPVVLAPKPLLTPFEVGTFLGARRPNEAHPSTSIVFSKKAGGYPLKVRRMHWNEVFAPKPKG